MIPKKVIFDPQPSLPCKPPFIRVFFQCFFKLVSLKAVRVLQWRSKVKTCRVRDVHPFPHPLQLLGPAKMKGPAALEKIQSVHWGMAESRRVRVCPQKPNYDELQKCGTETLELDGLSFGAKQKHLCSRHSWCFRFEPTPLGLQA